MDWDYSNVRIGVIGDMNLDIDYVGSFSGSMSREQESMAIFSSEPDQVYYTGGGAANIVEMLCCLGVDVVYPIGVWDTYSCAMSQILYKCLEDEMEVSTDFMVQGLDTPAFIKYYRPSGAHIFRANIESEPMNHDTEQSLIAKIKCLAGEELDLVIVADYDEAGKGVLTYPVLDAIEKLEMPRIGMSRRRIGRLYGYEYLILNQKELGVYTKGSEKTMVCELLSRTRARSVVLTRESAGATYFTHTEQFLDGDGCVGEVKESHAPSVPVLGIPIDSCGCGDALAACFAASLALGVEPIEALRRGNAAARAELRQLYGARRIVLSDVIGEYELLNEKENHG